METTSSSQDSSSSDINTSSSSYSQGNEELSDTTEKLKSEIYDALPTRARISKDKNPEQNTPSSDNSGSATDSSSSKRVVHSKNVESENSTSSKISSEKSESSNDSSSSSSNRSDDLKKIVSSEKEKTSGSVLARENSVKTVDVVKTMSEDRMSSNNPFDLKAENSDEKILESSEENKSGEHRNSKIIFGALKEITEHSESTSSSDNTDDRKSQVHTSHIVNEIDDDLEPSIERNVFTATHSRSAVKIKNTSRPKTTSPNKKKFSKTSTATHSRENIFEETEETFKISPGSSKRGRRRGKTVLQTKCKGGASEREKKASPQKRRLSLSPKKVPRKIRGRGRRTRSLPMISAPERSVLTETVAIVKEEDGVRAETQVNARSRTTYTVDGANQPSVTSETVAIFRDNELLPEYKSQAAIIVPFSGAESLESGDSNVAKCTKKTPSEYISHESDKREVINAGERKQKENDLRKPEENPENNSSNESEKILDSETSSEAPPEKSSEETCSSPKSSESQTSSEAPPEKSSEETCSSTKSSESQTNLLEEKHKPLEETSIRPSESSITFGKIKGLIITGSESPKQREPTRDMEKTESQDPLFKIPSQPPLPISRTDTSSESPYSTSGVSFEEFQRELRSGNSPVSDSFDLKKFDKALDEWEKNKSQETSSDSCQQNPLKSDEDSSDDDVNKAIAASGRVMKRYRIESSDEETRVMKNFERKKSKLCEDKSRESSSSPSDITNTTLEEDLYLSESTSKTPETSPDEFNKRSPSEDVNTTDNIKSPRADITIIEIPKKKICRKLDTSSESDEISGTMTESPLKKENFPGFIKSSKSEEKLQNPTAVLLEKYESPKSVSKSSESETSPKESPVKSSEESDSTTLNSKSSGSEENPEECSEEYAKESKLPERQKRNDSLKSNVKSSKSETSIKEIAENLKHNSLSKESTESQSSSQKSEENSKHNSSNESDKILDSETSSEESSAKSSEETCSSPKSSESQTSLQEEKQKPPEETSIRTSESSSAGSTKKSLRQEKLSDTEQGISSSESAKSFAISTVSAESSNEGARTLLEQSELNKPRKHSGIAKIYSEDNSESSEDQELKSRKKRFKTTDK